MLQLGVVVQRVVQIGRFLPMVARALQQKLIIGQKRVVERVSVCVFDVWARVYCYIANTKLLSLRAKWN